jgi:hypothetical protein
MVIVEEFGKLLAQAFVALAVVAENDGPLEQGVLKLLRQIAPKVSGCRSEDEKVTVRGIASDEIRCFVHDKLRLARPQRC